MESPLNHVFEARVLKPLLIIACTVPIAAKLGALEKLLIPLCQYCSVDGPVLRMRFEVDFLHLEMSTRFKRVVSILENCGRIFEAREQGTAVNETEFLTVDQFILCIVDLKLTIRWHVSYLAIIHIYSLVTLLVRLDWT